jgi:hypothetical protein
MLAVIMDFQSVIKKKNSTGSFLQFFENIRFKISAIQTALLTIATMLNFQMAQKTKIMLRMWPRYQDYLEYLALSKHKHRSLLFQHNQVHLIFIYNVDITVY